MFQVNEWETGHRGFLYDRQWMIVTDSGVCLTQKREPRLCLIKPSVDLPSKILSITAPGLEFLLIYFCYQQILNTGSGCDVSFLLLIMKVYVLFPKLFPSAWYYDTV